MIHDQSDAGAAPDRQPENDELGAELGRLASSFKGGGLFYRITLCERGVRLTLHRPLPEGRRRLPSRPREYLADHSDLLAEADRFLDKFLVPLSPDEQRGGGHRQ
jgi:hypothetical protein